MSRQRSIRRAAGPLTGGAVLAVLLGALVCASLLALHVPTRADRNALGAISFLSHATGVLAVEHIGAGTARGVLASCRVRGTRELVRAGDGSAFAVVAGHLRGTKGRRLALAIAELAACPKLLSIELANRLLLPQSVDLGIRRVAGRRAIVVLAHSIPRVTLFVDAKTFEPIAVEFKGRRYRGWSLVRAIRLTGHLSRPASRVCAGAASVC